MSKVDVRRMVDAAKQTFGRLDILMNNAGRALADFNAERILFAALGQVGG